LIVAPVEGDNNEYLYMMVRILWLLGKSEVREKIIAAATPQEVIDIVEKNEA